jgi:hypothetical protein
LAGLYWALSWLGAGPFLARHLPHMPLPEWLPKEETLVLLAAGLVFSLLAGLLVWRSARVE